MDILDAGYRCWWHLTGCRATSPAVVSLGLIKSGKGKRVGAVSPSPQVQVQPYHYMAMAVERFAWPS